MLPMNISVRSKVHSVEASVNEYLKYFPEDDSTAGVSEWKGLRLIPMIMCLSRSLPQKAAIAFGSLR